MTHDTPAAATPPATPPATPRARRGWCAAPLAVALLLSSSPALAQQGAAQPLGYKDPGTATLIGIFVPGGGQLWVGGEAQKKGLALLAIGYGGVLIVPLATVGSGSAAPALLGLVAYIGATAYGAVTADDAATTHNRKLGVRTTLLERVQPVIAPGREGTSVGLTVRF